MYFFWLLFLLPSFVFASGKCPQDVSVGNVTIATKLPFCVKYAGVTLGGCLIDCKGVCVEFPLANSKGPVFTTGGVCNLSGSSGENGGDGDKGGGDKGGPGQGGGSKNGWNYFEPALGDSTGTSVSSAIAKLNRNMGDAFVALDTIAARSNSTYWTLGNIDNSTTRAMAATERSKQLLDEIVDFNRTIKSNVEGINHYIGRFDNYLSSMDRNIEAINSKSGSGGGGGGGGTDVSKLESYLDYYLPNLSSINNASWRNVDSLVSIEESMGEVSTSLVLNGETLGDMNNSLKDMAKSFSELAGSISGAGGTGGTGSDKHIGEINESVKGISKILAGGVDGNGGGNGNGGGSSVDYGKMPGSGDNPLSVKGGSYKSNCRAVEGCFFDVAAMNNSLRNKEKALSDKYASIMEDAKGVFSFNLSGDADPLKCFELFSYKGQVYSVCPPSSDFWRTMATVMMFIFYFVAMMVIFKR